jgi:hypothetical protein
MKKFGLIVGLVALTVGITVWGETRSSKAHTQYDRGTVGSEVNHYETKRL